MHIVYTLTIHNFNSLTLVFSLMNTSFFLLCYSDIFLCYPDSTLHTLGQYLPKIVGKDIPIHVWFQREMCGELSHLIRWSSEVSSFNFSLSHWTHITFFFLCFLGHAPRDAQVSFLFLYSGITPEYSHETIWNARNQNQVKHMQGNALPTVI